MEIRVLIPLKCGPWTMSDGCMMPCIQIEQFYRRDLSKKKDSSDFRAYTFS